MSHLWACIAGAARGGARHSAAAARSHLARLYRRHTRSLRLHAITARVRRLEGFPGPAAQSRHSLYSVGRSSVANGCCSAHDRRSMARLGPVGPSGLLGHVCDCTGCSSSAARPARCHSSSPKRRRPSCRRRPTDEPPAVAHALPLLFSLAAGSVATATGSGSSQADVRRQRQQQQRQRQP